MGAYRLSSGGGVVRTADGAFIPQDTRNADWNAYQAWLAVPNTPDAIPVPDLAPYKAARSAEIRAEAERRRQVVAPLTLADLLRFREAELAAVDGTPTAGEYPLLDAQATATSSTIAAVATAVVAENLALREDLAPIEEALRLGLAAITAAANVAAVDAAVAAIVWP